MQQKTVLALAALGVFAILAFFTLRAPEKGARKGPRPRPVPAFKAADVKRLDLSSDNGKNKISLKLDGSAWKITAPGKWNADASLVKSMADQLEKLTFGDVVTENTAKYGDLELSDDKGAHVVAKDGSGKVLLDGWFGKAVSGFTMFRQAGKNDVWQSSGAFKYTFARDAATLRDHTVLDFSQGDVTKLTVEGDGQKLALEKIPPADKAGQATWKVLESTVKVDPLDDATANNLLQTMSTLRAGAFADDVKPADAGLATPRYTITAVVKGQPKTLLLGNTKGEETWAMVQGAPQIYVLPKYTVERLAVSPLNFRDKTLVKVKEADLTAVDVAMGSDRTSLKHDKDEWKLAAGGAADPNKVKMLVSAFENLQGSAFAVGVPAAQTGIDKSTTSVTLHLRDKSTVTLKVGSIKDATDYYVARLGSPDVMLVKKYMVDRFLKKSADLTKPAAAAAK